MMKKKLFVLLTVVCILALATACGSQTIPARTQIPMPALKAERAGGKHPDRQAGREKGLYVCCDG